MSASSFKTPDEEILSRSVIEAEYIEALDCLEHAQTERTEAVSHFLKIQAQWKQVTLRDACENQYLNISISGSADPLEQAEAELYRAKILYCNALEQQRLLQQMVAQLRMTFQRAQENLERLALEDQEGQTL